MCVLNFPLPSMSDLLVTTNFMLCFGTSDQNHVFKLGACFLKLMPSKGEHCDCTLNKYVDLLFAPNFILLSKDKASECS